MVEFSRRAILASGASILASAAGADAPITSLRPRGRTLPEPAKVTKMRPRARPDTAQLIEERNFGGDVSFAVADVATGRLLVDVGGTTKLPPASVTKAVTALYSLEALGENYQFKTRLIVDGTITGGVLNGNLIIAGGGDPRLQTNDLAELADILVESGVRQVRGDLIVWGGALQRVDEIDASQADHLGYNPAVSGLNLNFNRVHFEWKQNGANYDITMDARSVENRADVNVARMRVVDRGAPVYEYTDLGNVDDWSVAKGALGEFGSRWLPVREPALYVGDVFRTFARDRGIVLSPAKRTNETPSGTVLGTIVSPPLKEVVRDMLKFSTNLTAEICGMAATNRLSGENRGLRTSALGMSRWCTRKAGILPSFVDHSGLGDASQISAESMVSLLTQKGAFETLEPLMTNIRMVDANRNSIPGFRGSVAAKTGTLNFVSALAGYIKTESGRDLAFAFFAADLEAREIGKQSSSDRPRGAATYNNRARWLQQQLLQYWARAGDT